MPNKRFYKRLKEASTLSEKVKTERLIILSLAYNEADRKFYSVERDIRKQEERLLTIPHEHQGERKKIEDDIKYLKETCLAGWQETLDEIDKWKKELDRKEQNFHGRNK